MKNIKILLSTFSCHGDAMQFANKLVENNLSPCVQIIANIDSIYKWEGEIHHEKEILLMIKVKIEHEEKIKDWIKKYHPYEVPEIISLNANILNEDYASWFFNTW